MRRAWRQTSTEKKKNGKAKGGPVAFCNRTRPLNCQSTFQLTVSHFVVKMKRLCFRVVINSLTLAFL